MIGKRNIENLKNLSHLKPSIKFVEYSTPNQTYLDAYLYIHLDREKTRDGLGFDIIGRIGAGRNNISTIDNGTKNPFVISGITGAYPGLGSLLYDSFLYELQRKYGDNGFIMCDRSSITGEAENLYMKMDKHDLFEKIVVKPSDLPFTEDIEYDYDDCFSNFDSYLDAIENGDNRATPSHINKAYRLIPTKEIEAIVKKLSKNDKESDLTKDEIEKLKDYGSTLGDSILESPEIFAEEVINGFKGFDDVKRSNSPKVLLKGYS